VAVFKRAQWTHLGFGWLTLCAFPVAMTAWAFYYRAGDVSVGMAVLLFLVASAFVPFMLAFIVWGWRRAHANSPIFQDPFIGSVSEDRFALEAETGRTDMTWDRFIGRREGKDVVLLYQAPNLFNILAREFFESDADWETARRFTMRVPARRRRAATGK
jgi:hypothetical protein